MKRWLLSVRLKAQPTVLEPPSNSCHFLPQITPLRSLFFLTFICSSSYKYHQNWRESVHRCFTGLCWRVSCLSVTCHSPGAGDAAAPQVTMFLDILVTKIPPENVGTAARLASLKGVTDSRVRTEPTVEA